MKKRASKKEEGKADLSLVSPILEEGLARVMMFGAKKHGRHDYLNGLVVSDFLAALKRHVNRFQMGEDIDPESGLNHLFHVVANAQILIDNIHQGTAQDDRYKYK